jgi:hypothetical protein
MEIHQRRKKKTGKTYFFYTEKKVEKFEFFIILSEIYMNGEK